MGSSDPYCQSSVRDGGVQGVEVRQDKEEGMEADGDQGDVCWGQLHQEAAQVREVHPADGPPHEQGARHAPGAEGHVLSAHHWGEEEPLQSHVHQPGSYYKGDLHNRYSPNTNLFDMELHSIVAKLVRTKVLFSNNICGLLTLGWFLVSNCNVCCRELCSR